MAQFPRTEPQTVILAQDIATRGAANVAIYPLPLVAAYKTQRRLRPAGPWPNASLAMESEITLTGQAPDKKWEYRVIAVNNAGHGEPSNTVMAVL